MKTLVYTIEKHIPDIRKSTTLHHYPNENRLRIHYKGHIGDINRSGHIIARDIEYNKIMEHSHEVSIILKSIFGEHFVNLGDKGREREKIIDKILAI